MQSSCGGVAVGADKEEEEHHKNPEKQLLEYYNELKATTSDPETKLNICYSIRGGVSRILCILRNKISSLDKAFDYRGLFADMVDSLVAEIRSKYTSLFDPDIKPAISFLEKFNDTTDIGKFLKLDIYKKLGSGEFIPVTDQGKLLIARMGAIATLAKDMPLRESAKDDENTADTDAEKAFADAAICTAHDISRLCRPWDENDRDEENSLQGPIFDILCRGALSGLAGRQQHKVICLVAACCLEWASAGLRRKYEDDEDSYFEFPDVNYVVEAVRLQAFTEKQMDEFVKVIFHHDKVEIPDSYVSVVKKVIRHVWYSMAYPMDECPVDETAERPLVIPPITPKRKQCDVGDSKEKKAKKK